MASRTPWAFWVEHHMCRRPSGAHAAADDRPSSGQAARRWLTNRSPTTTSQPAKKSWSRSSPPKVTAMLVPTSGYRSTPSSTASSTSTTTGSGS
jgi:hypothetical protein